MDEQYVKGRRATMVKVGFIVEGTSDFIFIKSDKFLKFLFHKLSLDSDEEKILISCNKSNLKTNLKSYLSKLGKTVEYVFIMVDQDNKEALKKNRKYSPPDCPMVVVKEIVGYRDNSRYVKENHIFIVMTREFEAWLLADESLGYHFEGPPEEIMNPSEIIEKQEKTSNHVIIAKRNADKFSLVRAAKNAPSAKRFLNKLETISSQ